MDKGCKDLPKRPVKVNAVDIDTFFNPKRASFYYVISEVVNRCLFKRYLGHRYRLIFENNGVENLEPSVKFR